MKKSVEFVTERGIKIFILNVGNQRGILMTDKILGASQPMVIGNEVLFILCGCCLYSKGSEERQKIVDFIERTCESNGVKTLVTTHPGYFDPKTGEYPVNGVTLA